MLADPQHRHHHRGRCQGAAAAYGAARDHQQPQRRDHPERQPGLRGDRGWRLGAAARPGDRRRGDHRLHSPVQGRHRPDRRVEHRSRRHPARLRPARGEGGSNHHRAGARGVAGGRCEQVQPAGHDPVGDAGADRCALHRRRAAGALPRAAQECAGPHAHRALIDERTHAHRPTRAVTDFIPETPT
ncbi:hypothetical protein VARIO8X_60466 [Burkholderiales bacterium 8X]|nr:hypothetical protein VARIO8X_60466 [Burkholderiales bacterium 8X]